jgi:hypothetical protein
VETFLDAVLAVQEHVDPSLIMLRSAKHRRNRDAGKKDNDVRAGKSPSKYEELWQLEGA